MGTRSDIIVKRNDGKWARVYCHWDGYPDHNGVILQENYNNQLLAEKLVKEGDMSSLDESCDKPEGHSFDNKIPGYTVYYGRDRGETGTKAKIYKTLKGAYPKEDSWTEYTYVWDGDKWLVGDPHKGPDSLVLLQDVLDGKTIIESDIMFPMGVLGKHTS